MNLYGIFHYKLYKPSSDWDTPSHMETSIYWAVLASSTAWGLSWLSPAWLLVKRIGSNRMAWPEKSTATTGSRGTVRCVTRQSQCWGLHLRSPWQTFDRKREDFKLRDEHVIDAICWYLSNGTNGHITNQRPKLKIPMSNHVKSSMQTNTFVPATCRPGVKACALLKIWARKSHARTIDIAHRPFSIAA